MIAVVDYHKGNLKSVERGLWAVGGDARITDDPEVIARAEGVVLPGVGAFADASDAMNRLGLMSVVRDSIAQGVPFLGICLGMHLMFEEGTEGAEVEDDDVDSNNARGLAVLPGVVYRMPNVDEAGNHYKVPHVGWNSIEFSAEDRESCPLLQGVREGEYFYFTHSFVAPDSPCTRTTTTHSITFPSTVQYRDSAFGVQFHPEKSSDAGARILKNFLGVVTAAGGR